MAKQQMSAGDAEPQVSAGPEGLMFVCFWIYVLAFVKGFEGIRGLNKGWQHMELGVHGLQQQLLMTMHDHAQP